MMFPDESKSIVEEINNPFLKKQNVQLFIKREDLIHPYISGNKWRKLKYNLEEARKQKKDTLLSFGGAFSNHIYALAEAGNLYGFNTIGIIRGEKHSILNPTLSFATKKGMQLQYIDRNLYRLKNTDSFMSQLHDKLGDFYAIPEGGSNYLAIRGCQEILTENEYNTYDYICCCCGTGGTLAGIIKGSHGKSNIIGFSVLKGDFLKHHLNCMLLEEDKNHDAKSNWSLNNAYHFGGYAKKSIELDNFIYSFLKENNIILEFVYTGKMFFGIYELLKQEYFKKGSKILAIHTGGVRRIEN